MKTERWEVRHDLGVYDENGHLVCHTGLGQYDGPYREDAAKKAALIVRAVNNHAAMFEALKKALAYLEGGNPNMTSGGHKNVDLREIIKSALSTAQPEENTR